MNMLLQPGAAAFAAVVLCAACSLPGVPTSAPATPSQQQQTATAAPSPQGAGGVVTHSFAPAAADPRVIDFREPDIAAFASGVATNRLLFVFLPGTGGQPSCCTLLLRSAAALGFHALGLQYADSPAVGTRCGDDLSCYGMVRRNVFDGADAGPLSNLAPADTVQQRLVAALRYLAESYPAEGWSAFLQGGDPAYASIVFGGHSQGGGEADFVSTLVKVRGVVALSSPPDTDSALNPARWLTSRGITGASSIVGFYHAGDPFGPRITADWTAMGLGAFGGPASAESSPPYDSSHEILSVAALPAVPLAAHDSTAVDSATPLCPDGMPRYTPVWIYMLQVAGGLAISNSAPAC